MLYYNKILNSKDFQFFPEFLIISILKHNSNVFDQLIFLIDEFNSQIVKILHLPADSCLQDKFENFLKCLSAIKLSIYSRNVEKNEFSTP